MFLHCLTYENMLLFINKLYKVYLISLPNSLVNFETYLPVTGNTGRHG